MHQFAQRQGKTRRRGIVLIEFSIGFLFVFLPLAMALIQYGIILQTTLSLDNLSREVGRYASVNALAATNDTDIKSYITTSAAKLGVAIANPNNDITITPAVNAAGQAATRVRYAPITVTIQYDMNSKNFLAAPFTAAFKIPIFKSYYSTKVVMVMQ